MNLIDLGWNENLEQELKTLDSDNKLLPCRVGMAHKNRYVLFSEKGELSGEVSGRFIHNTSWRSDFPSVGDWVAVSLPDNSGLAIIQAVLPRKSYFSRKAVLSGGNPDSGGKTDEQILAANIDTVFIVSGLDNEYNQRRLERYITSAWNSGANPVIILNKTDICENVGAIIKQTEAIAFGIPILTVSAMQKQGIEQIQEYLGEGKTAVFLGSSGVGKSTIINNLLGEERLKTSDVRAYDSKGRHTTTHREMFFLPQGGIVIDTPGMKGIKVWIDENGLSKTFADIEELSSQCRFKNCQHNREPGCAINQALEDGVLDPKRYQNYLKQQKEQKFMVMRKDEKTRREHERKLCKFYKSHSKAQKILRKRGMR